AAAAGPAVGGGVTGVKAGVLAAGTVAVLLGGWAWWPDGGGEPERPAPVVSAAPSSAPAPRASAAPPPPPSVTASPSPSSSPPAPAVSAGTRPVAPGGPSTLRFVSTGGCLQIPRGAARSGVRPVEAGS